MVGEEDVLTSPLRLALSGDVPAHSWVSAPCGVGYNSTRIRNLVNEPNKPVNDVIESQKRLEGLLSRLA